MTQQWEVIDGYTKVWFTGSLKACGVWIDPIMGIDFDSSAWGKQADGTSIDSALFRLNDDGSYTVKEVQGSGEFTVRKVEP